MIEEWRAIAGYKGYYEISDLGRIKSLERVTSDGRVLREKIRKTANYNSRYLSISLSRDSKVEHRNLHAVVLTAFKGKCPPGREARHLDGNSANNALTNLAWGTPKENTADKRAHGTFLRGEQCSAAKLCAADVKNIRRRFAAGEQQRSLATEYAVRQPTISKIVTRQRWGHLL